MAISAGLCSAKILAIATCRVIRSTAPAVPEIAAARLRPGLLAEMFARGAPAVILHFDGELRRIWSVMVDDRAEQMPWEASLADMARNHHGSSDITTSLGDLFYFQPGQHGYIARKLEIERGRDGIRRVTPARFVQGGDEHVPAGAGIDGCCDIADAIMAALTPAGQASRRYRVALQRLKYQDGADEFGDLAALLYHSLARWSRVGFRIDRQRGRLNPALGGKGVSDLLAILMLIPGLRSLVKLLARLFGDPRRDWPSGEGAALLEREHVDARYFSALCGRRDGLSTQIFAGGEWVDLPIGLDHLAVIPGALARREFGLRATPHRVIYSGRRSGKAIDPRTGNVTLLIGAV